MKKPTTKAEAMTEAQQANEDAAMCHINKAPTAAIVYERRAARFFALAATLPD